MVLQVKRTGTGRSNALTAATQVAKSGAIKLPIATPYKTTPMDTPVIRWVNELIMGRWKL